MRIFGLRAGNRLSRFTWIGVLVSICIGSQLTGCATPNAMKQANTNAHKALSQSQALSHQLAMEKKARKRQVSKLNARLQSLSRSQSGLAHQLAMINRRLTSSEKRWSQRFSQNKAQTKLLSTTAHAGQVTGSGTHFMAQLIKRVKLAASHPYKPPQTISPALSQLHFKAYNQLQFKGKITGWPAGSQFKPSFYPAGYLFHHAVKIYLLKDGKPVRLKLPVKDFNFGSSLAKKLSNPVPLAGFSLYYPFNPRHGINEFLSFLGASYFRALGKNQSWGLSARGLAIDTAVPHHAEEFPYFRDFWIVPPKRNAKKIVFYAQLDSPSYVGAYRFVVHPGSQTVVNVSLVLYTRKTVKRLGIAPLTSMYLQGGNGGKRFNRLVRAAHDSDGLSIETRKGHWLWVPLHNPKRLVVDRMPFSDIRGFGLMQRARKYADYQAWGMKYQKRPSAWITPTGGDWNKGHIVLIELPTNSQTNDNITAFWEPVSQPKPGQPMAFKYRISWQGDHLALPSSVGHVVRTRYGRAKGNKETYIIDFKGGGLAGVPGWVHLKPVVKLQGHASLVNSWVAKNTSTGDWRLEFTVQPKGNATVSMQAYLAYDKRTLTETWKTQLHVH